MKKTIATMSAAALLLAAASTYAQTAAPAAPAAAAPAAPAAPAKPKAGDMLPEFTVMGYPGEAPVDGKTLIGKATATAIVFFNTGCSSCLAELTEASVALKAVNDPTKLLVYAVAVDKRGAKSVEMYEESYKFGVNYFLDPDFKLPPKFGFRYTPAMVVVDKTGRITEIKGGFDPVAEKGSVQKLLMEAAK